MAAIAGLADVEDFKLMLKHMYTGETDFINGQNVLSLLSLASYFNIHSLKVCTPPHTHDRTRTRLHTHDHTRVADVCDVALWLGGWGAMTGDVR